MQPVPVSYLLWTVGIFLYISGCTEDAPLPPSEDRNCAPGTVATENACEPVECPDNATLVEEECSCDTGYYGTIQWAEDDERYTGSCIDIFEEALDTGSIDRLNQELALTKTLETAVAVQNQFSDLLDSIYQGTAPQYNPTEWSHHIFTTSLEDNEALLIGSDHGYPLATFGQSAIARRAAFGSNPMEQFTAGESESFIDPFNRLVAWLAHGDARTATTESFRIGIAGVPIAPFQDPTLLHLSFYFENADITYCDTIETISDCFQDSDLVLMGSNGNDADAAVVENALRQAQELGTAVLYLHSHYWDTTLYGEAVLNALDMRYGNYGGNYWDIDEAAWDSYDAFIADGGFLGSIVRLLRHLEAEDYSFDWSGCTEFVGQIFCYEAEGFRQEFLAGAQAIQTALRFLDENNHALFETDGQSLLKGLVLLAEVIRTQIAYPMSKTDSTIQPFMRAYFADHVVHYHRAHQNLQSDLGSFSRVLTTEDVSLSDFELDIDVSARGGYTTTGTYVLPGQPITIERLDSSTRDVWFKINTQRIGSTREFNDGQYDRPKFLQSPQMPLSARGPITISTPYGGALQIVTNEADSADVISLRVTNVSQHPVLEDMADLGEYLADLEETVFDFTEIKTPFVQIHAQTDMMRTAFNAERYFDDTDLFFEYLETYMIQDTYNLAGFAGSTLSLNDSVTSYCQTLGWDCEAANTHSAPSVQHINIDAYAHCGGGCAGNPYDQAWPLDPLGWGETHEIGHNLQRARLGIYDGRSSEVSNQIFPLHKHYMFALESGESLSPNRSAYKETFDILQASVAEADPVQYVYEAIWSNEGIYDNNNERIAFYMQVVHTNDHIEFLDSGWELYTMMYLHERLFSDAIADSSKWATMGDDLGFSTYPSAPSDLSGNDFMLISLSFLSQKDQRPFFDMWGITYSTEASAQVDSYGFAPAAQEFYASDDANVAPLSVPVPIDGTSPWPLSD